MQGTITWTPEKLARFKTVYSQADHTSQLNAFEFDGYQFLVGYAKYLIEYLEGMFVIPMEKRKVNV